MAWATLWAIIPKTHPVTLHVSAAAGVPLTDVAQLFPSVAFIRHPFSRLVSGYLERIVREMQENGDNSTYATFGNMVRL
jgi:hypothetical protein